MWSGGEEMQGLGGKFEGWKLNWEDVDWIHVAQNIDKGQGCLLSW
jgi:hypothetical protein